ncbi:MAG: extensin family protein [Pseudomonadota bacterium]
MARGSPTSSTARVVALLCAGLAILPATAPAADWRWPTDAAGRLIPADRFPCHEPRIEGRLLEPIGKPPTACGIALPVRVEALAGVRLSQPTTLSCPAARRMAQWVERIVQPTAKRVLRARVTSLDVSGGYVCRRRNFAADGPLSQHAFGRALDVAGFRLSRGRTARIARDWGKGDAGLFLQLVHREACGLFTTVLGPEADAQHRDHFHLDISPRRRPYCR